VKNCVENAEGISHGQRLVTAGCRVCGIGYEMVGLRFAFQKKNAKRSLRFAKCPITIQNADFFAFVIVICTTVRVGLSE
jgi:hypothetical protein